MNLIVAVDQNWAIGKGGNQLVYLSEDLKRFKKLTLGHSVILGSKTLSTFPKGRPLKERQNLILSRKLEFVPDGAKIFRDIDDLLSFAPPDSFVVGGASVYAALLSKCDTAYVTKISASFPNADRWFPNLDLSSEWAVFEESSEMEEHGVKFQYVTYKRYSNEMR